MVCNQLKASQVAVGLSSDKIVSWRYWDKSDVPYSYKMINITDEPVIISMQEGHYEDYNHFKIDSSILSDIIISPRAHLIFNLDMECKRSHYLSFQVNGDHIGLLGMDTKYPPYLFNSMKYCSMEGVNGRSFGGVFWISKNEVISKSPNDSIMFHFYYHERGMADEDGICFLQFSVRNKLDTLKFVKETVTVNYIDSIDSYNLLVPFSAESWGKTNEPFDVKFVYNISDDVNGLTKIPIGVGLNTPKRAKCASIEEMMFRLNIYSYGNIPVLYLRKSPSK